MCLDFVNKGHLVLNGATRENTHGTPSAVTAFQFTLTVIPTLFQQLLLLCTGEKEQENSFCSPSALINGGTCYAVGSGIVSVGFHNKMKVRLEMVVVWFKSWLRCASVCSLNKEILHKWDVSSLPLKRPSIQPTPTPTSGIVVMLQKPALLSAAQVLWLCKVSSWPNWWPNRLTENSYKSYKL